jgi:hypothetical protein
LGECGDAPAREDGMVEPDKVIGSSEMPDTELKPKMPSSEGARAAAEAVRSAAEAARAAAESLPKMDVTVVEGVPPVIGSPIGALPGAAEALPALRFAEMLGEAQRYIAMFRRGVRDITTASFKLALLPVNMAVFAVRKLRPLRT